MDARAGAVTDARAKGASRADAMELATHTQEPTNRRYDRDRIDAPRAGWRRTDPENR
jgi:hypothetical protein